MIFQRGARLVYRIVGYDEKATITVLFSASANGELVPPLVLFNLKKPPKRAAL